MVEFCTVCGTSLPKGDLTVRGGRLYTSHDYDCPSCRQRANPAPEAAAEPEAQADRDLLFRGGEVRSE
jgi:hypothetical protein